MSAGERWSRRGFIGGCALLATPFLARAQFSDYFLTIKRETNLSTVLDLNDCVKGRLFVGPTYYHGPQNAIAGAEFCDTLELPWRNNLDEISCCPPGEHKAFIRTDGTLGWRVELADVVARDNIQIHIGNSPRDIAGCILPGRWSPSRACFVQASGASIAALKMMMGSAHRPVYVKIVA
ncbi:DUF5675 family protein [Shinella sp. BYT-45]|uniref:DUF5675 family protein n=1 Tax=Shinella sp. BYT-45 TaxID=3377377 RepID=UPI00397EDFA9